MTSSFLTIDFSGTNLTTAVISLGTRQWQAHRRAFSPPNVDATTEIKIMTTLAHEVLWGEQPAAIRASFGRPVNFTTGTV